MSQQRREENKHKREEEVKFRSSYGVPKELLRTSQDLNRRPKILYKKAVKKTKKNGTKTSEMDLYLKEDVLIEFGCIVQK